VVAPLDRVIEEPENAVAVVAIVLGGVDAPLRRHAVGTARAILITETGNLIAHLAQRCRCRRASQPGPHDDDVKAAAVGRVHQFQLKAGLVPLFFNRAGRHSGIQGRLGECRNSLHCRSSRSCHRNFPFRSYCKMPNWTANGTAANPTGTTMATIHATPRATAPHSRVPAPNVRNTLQAP